MSKNYPTNTRRDFLLRGGAGFGALALTGMLSGDTAFATDRGNHDSIKQPHFTPTAKRVIFLFMEGGPSHMDLFDPKPLIQKLAGQRMPESFKGLLPPWARPNHRYFLVNANGNNMAKAAFGSVTGYHIPLNA